jgi:hypothetical protein
MDLYEMLASTDKILNAHRNGNRIEHETLENLKALNDGLDTELRQRFFENLFDVMSRKIKAMPIEHTAGRVLRPDILGVIIRMCSRHGPVMQAYASFFSNLITTSDVVVENWVKYIIPAMSGCIRSFSSRFEPKALEMIKEYCHRYTSEYSAQISGCTFPHDLVAGLKNIEEVIEDVELYNFESRLRASAAAKQAHTNTASTEKDYLKAYLMGFSPQIYHAMEEAHKYLTTSGPLNCKKAADLIRTSIDEVHRALVNRIASANGSQYTGDDKDGQRRMYMRKMNFISEPEEKFFSAIYSLISNEASHKLNAPKETILVMHRTVSDYLLLLLRRLDDFENSDLTQAAT